jgi:hypothetical protein
VARLLRGIGVEVTVHQLLAFAVIAALAPSAWAAPTKHVGQELTKGVTGEVKKEAANIDLQEGARKVSRGFVQGAHDARQELFDAERDAGRAVSRGALGETRDQLGADGNGPLARSMAGAGERLAAAAVHGAAQELVRELPACQGRSREACMRHYVEQYAYISSRSAARGAADGSSPWTTTTMISFAAGLVVGLITSVFIALLLGQRRLKGELTRLRPRET